MKIVGLMPVRNEAWCLGVSLRVALQWCDEVIALDHASTDSTPAILREIQLEQRESRLAITREENRKWDEMTHRQWMLDAARRLGGTHIAIIDADEILTLNLLPHIRGFCEKLKPGAMLQLPLYNLRGGVDRYDPNAARRDRVISTDWMDHASLHRYHANGLWGDRILSTVFLDHPALHWSGDTFHAREPRGCKWTPYQPIGHGYGGVLHLWGASERRLRAKHALYKLAERLRWPDKPVAEIDRMYSMCVNGGTPGEAQEWRYAAIASDWWHPKLMHHLHVEAEPWQEAEVARLIAAHGREAFAGLDLFGL